MQRYGGFPTNVILTLVANVLKYMNHVTKDVEARHPISLLAPDADDILLGEWHWVSVGAVRTFPVAEYWYKHYVMMHNNNNANDQKEEEERRRSMQLHYRMCQKVLYNSTCTTTTTCTDSSRRSRNHRLLLRSHLSPCIRDFQELYPDAVIVGIVRDPVDVLRSFAGLSAAAVLAATGVDMLATAAKNETSTPITGAHGPTPHETRRFPQIMVDILSDMMERESKLYNNNDDDGKYYDDDDNKSPWHGRCHYVTFTDFQSNPLACLQRLYAQMDMQMTRPMELALQSSKNDTGDDYLRQFESYKTRHVYQNPTLAELEVDEAEFLNLASVKRYSQLLQCRR
jgi:hypothetical protein